jgi:hypothetical protein
MFPTSHDICVLKCHPKVRWKDSIKKVMASAGSQ